MKKPGPSRWREKLEAPQEPKIVAIPARMQRQWGEGTMAIARPLDVDAMVRKVRKGELATVKQKARQEQLKKQLESQRQKEQQAREQRNKEQNRNIFQRFRAAWKAKWQNRTVKANQQSPFENAGFGENTQRAVLPINNKWVFRPDLNKRIPKPQPVRPPPRPPAMTPTF